MGYLNFPDGSALLWRGSIGERIAMFEALARQVLREAGLPDRLLEEPGAIPLRDAVQDIERRVRHRTIVTHREIVTARMLKTAVQMLGYAETLRWAVTKGDAETAAHYALTLALEGDGLALDYEFGPDLKAGQNQREGGIKGGRRAREVSEARERHRLWAEEDERLEKEGLGPTVRARRIARRHSARLETVRSAVRRYRKKLVSEAPSSPGE